MKNTNSFTRALFIVFYLLTGLISRAQNPTYEMFVTNESQPDSKTYQFDVYLLSTGSMPLELANLQFGLGFDTSITNGGTLSFSYVKGSSQLKTNQTPFNVSITKPHDVVVINDIAYRFVNQLARPGPGSGNASIISSTKAKCDSPGTRIGTYIIKNTEDFKPNSTCKHFFSVVNGPGRSKTIVNGYIEKMNTTLEGKLFSYNTKKTCDDNLILNRTKKKKK